MATYNFSNFSSTGIATGLNGILQSADSQQEAEFYERKDESGNVIATVKLNETDTMNVEYIYDSTTTAPALGDAITAGTDKYEVQSVGKSWAVGDDEKLKFTMKRYVSGDYPANA